MKLLTQYREELIASITDKLSGIQDSVMTTSEAVESKLLPFAISGKLVRGSLVRGIHDFYKGTKKEEVTRAATAIELFHSGLLIIDDIIDKDTMRRGRPTIHTQYLNELKDEHHAKSLAMCLGLVSIFQGISLLRNQPQEIIDLTGHLLTWCGYGEMQEVHCTVTQKTTVEEVIAIYKNKTATYTFSLPMSIGAILAEAPADEVEKIHKLGEHLGLIFQIIDDFIETLGPEVTGKSITDYENEVQTISQLIGEEKTKELIDTHVQHAKEIIQTMRVQEPYLEMIEYLLKRTK